jgi:acetyl esterase/lipase
MRYDDAFANAKHIAGGAEYPARWAVTAEAFRTGLGSRAQLGLRYGEEAAAWFDLFLPEGAPEGLCVFIHGGYWLAFGPRDFSHLAAGALARGWAVAMPAYTLAPEARISDMTIEIVAALERMSATVSGPLVIAGHSAGGHLAARMACTDVELSADVASRIKRIVPISPLSDLRPLIETSMNTELAIDVAEARRESPALMAPRSGMHIHVWVGSAERPMFLDQARRLGNAWACPVSIDIGRHHFDVVEGLEQSDSGLMTALMS